MIYEYLIYIEVVDSVCLVCYYGSNNPDKCPVKDDLDKRRHFLSTLHLNIYNNFCLGHYDYILS